MVPPPFNRGGHGITRAKDSPHLRHHHHRLAFLPVILLLSNTTLLELYPGFYRS